MTRIAVIADPHVHDTQWQPAGSGLPGAIRSFDETIASTRVFNESLPAFRAALTRAVAEGADLVLLAGDLTDDGQAPNIRAAMALIDEFHTRHGLRVLAVPGNHDCFALHGRPQVKEFLTATGMPAYLDSATCPEAATLGTAAALELMASLYQPAPQDLHWETPYGQDPAWQARTCAVQSPDGATRVQMTDASYLAEPLPDLWVLALDANVWAPRDGATDLRDPASFTDPGKTGWQAVLHHRPHLFAWMTDVARRARAADKTLLAISHYPPVDVLAGASAEECKVLNGQGLAARTPPPEIARAFAATGIGLHFSGHLHVNDTALWQGEEGRFVNIALPSTAGFCPAMKIIDLRPGRAEIRSLLLDQVPGFDHGFAAWRAAAQQAGMPADPACFATSHADFLDRHLTALVRGRYLPREWPPELADFVMRGRMADLLAVLGLDADLPDLALSTLATDWYRLRKGGELALPFIPQSRIDCYRTLLAILPPRDDTSLAGQLGRILRILGLYLDRLPNADFSIDLNTLSLCRDGG